MVIRPTLTTNVTLLTKAVKAVSVVVVVDRIKQP